MSKFYNGTELKNLNADYNIILGERTGGKSYWTKNYVVSDCVKHKEKFVYLRRYDSDIKTIDVQQYFSDTNCKKLGFDLITVYRSELYATEIDNEGNYKRLYCIGRAMSLSRMVSYKSQIFNDYTHIIYEEFVTDDIYLDNEPDTLLDFISTIFRNRKGKVWLIGNKLTRFCPYYFEWGLTRLSKQKNDTIDIYRLKAGEEEITIAVELTDKYGNDKMTFGHKRKNVTEGEWETRIYPKPPHPKNEYTVLYEILYMYSGFKFVVSLLSHGDYLCIKIYPYTTDRNITRKITDEFSADVFTTPVLNVKNKAEMKIKELFALNKIVYSDNLTGTDFNNALKKFNPFC